jgi:hypothetical protein
MSQKLICQFIAYLEKAFLDKTSARESSSNFTQTSVLPKADDLQSKALSLLMLPLTIPYKICLFFVLIPVRLADQLVDLALKKLKMTKGDAQVYARRVAKKQIKYMRNFCLLVVLLVAVFSVSLGISATTYAGMYLYLVPLQSQEVAVYFNYVPVDQQ